MLEEQLRGAAAGCEVGRRDTMQRQHDGAECLVLGDSIIRNMETFRELELNNCKELRKTEI
jgi:hypothetical protein